MSKEVYTEKDIYEGMVLERVKSGTRWWTVGKQYVVDKNLCIYDEDGESADYGFIIDSVNDGRFKVIKPEEKQCILQLFKYNFGLKIGDVEEISVGQGDNLIYKYYRFDQKHITIPAYNTQQAIDYLTNELDYDINDIVSMEVK